MRVAVVVERVWDPASIEVDPVSGAVDWSRAAAVPGPGALEAVELGLGLGEVTVYGLGVEPVAGLLRTCMAMGAGRVVAAPAVEAVAAALAGEAFDLVLAPQRSGDQGPSPLGPMLGGLLDLPQATGVESLRVEDREAVVVCLRDRGALEELAVPLPAVIAIEPGLVRPHLASPAALIAAAAVQVPALAPAAGPALRPVLLGHAPPRPPPPRLPAPDPSLTAEERIAAVVGTAEGGGRELATGGPDAVAERIVRLLVERGYL